MPLGSRRRVPTAAVPTEIRYQQRGAASAFPWVKPAGRYNLFAATAAPAKDWQSQPHEYQSDQSHQGQGEQAQPNLLLQSHWRITRKVEFIGGWPD